MIKKNDDVNVQSIIDNLDIPQTAKCTVPVEERPEISYQSPDFHPEAEKAEYQGRLWKEFLECLREPDDDEYFSKSSKRYAIDEDIVATLHQCHFGRSNAMVINAILRAFLTDNILHLRKLPKPKVFSLLDKINQP